MRFDRRSTGAPYLNRRDQRRLLGLVGMLAIVMVTIQMAARPSTWNWFAAVTQDAGPASQPPGPVKPIQIRRPAAAEPLAGDAVYARVAEDAENSAQAVAPAAEAGLLFPEGLLTGVADDWFGMTREEQPALVRAADFLAKIDVGALSRAADRDATFDVLMGDPDYYRGRPVTIHGRLKRLTRARIGTSQTQRDVWEAWIVSPDSRNVPYLVYALSIPEGLQPGEVMDEEVNLFGYLVRRFAYASAGGEAITLMLFTPRLEWIPASPPVAKQISVELRWTTVIFASFLGLILVGVGTWYLFSDRRFRRSRAYAIGESRLDAAPDELHALAALDGGDPHRIQIEDPDSPRV